MSELQTAKDNEPHEKRKRGRPSKKMAAVAVIFLLFAAVGVFAAVSVASVPVTITVHEPFTISSDPWIVDAFPGDEICHDVTVDNAAPHDLNARFAFIETNNTNGVTYTTAMPEVRIVPATSGIVYSACITINPDSPVGQLEGFVDVERVA